METVQFNVRIAKPLKGAVEDWCQTSGETIAHFVQEALIDRLEEIEDIEDLRSLRHEPTRPFSDVLAELGLEDDA